MDIEKLISLQNRVYIHALNRKVGNVIPADILRSQLAAGADPHSVAKLIIKTKKEMTRIAETERDQNSPKAKPKTKFERFVYWLKHQYK